MGNGANYVSSGFAAAVASGPASMPKPDREVSFDVDPGRHCGRRGIASLRV